MHQQTMSRAEDYQEQGVTLFNQRDFEASARAFDKAKELYIEDGRTDMAAEMKVNIGLVHRNLGEYQQALEMMEEALRTFQDTEDLMRAAQVLGNMGGVYAALNDKEQAYTAYRQAADIFLELDETKLHSETLMAIGRLQVADGKIFTGAATYQVGLEYLEDLTPRQKILKRLSTFINRLSGAAN